MKKNIILVAILLAISYTNGLTAESKIELYGHETQMSSDPKSNSVEMDYNVAIQAHTLRNNIADMGAQVTIEKIPVPFISHDFLKGILSPVMEQLYDYNFKAPENQKVKKRTELIQTIENLNNEKLIELLLAANYLDIRILEKKERQSQIDSGLIISLIDEIQNILIERIIKTITTSNLSEFKFEEKIETSPDTQQTKVTLKSDLIDRIPAELRIAMLPKLAEAIETPKTPIISLPIKNELTLAAFSKNFSLIATIDKQNKLLVWQTKDSKLLHEFESRSKINSAAFSNDGKMIIIGLNSKKAVILDSMTGKTINALNTNAPVTAAALSPDNKQAATASSDEIINIWKLDTFTKKIERKTPKFTIAAPAGINTLEYSNNGKMIIAGNNDKKLTFILASDSGKLITKLTSPQEYPIGFATFSPDNQKAFTGYFDAYIWDASNGTQIKQIIAQDATAAAFTRTGQFSPNLNNHEVVTLSSDNIIRVWNIFGPTATIDKPVFRFKRNSCILAVFNTTGSAIITVDAKGNIIGHELPTNVNNAELDMETLIDKLYQRQKYKTEILNPNS